MQGIGMRKIISIITINWNNAAGLRQTIESVTTQLTDQCEYLIIDGQSDDGSGEVIKEFSHHITYQSSEPRKGVYNAMNKGIERATGAYCLFLNAGDWLCPGALTQAVAACTGEAVIYFNTYLSYSNTRFEEQRYPTTLTMRSFFRHTIGHQTTLIKRALFTGYGLYNEQNRLYSDYEFWMKTIIHGNVSCKYVNKFLAYYDMGGISTEPDESASEELAAIQRKYLPKRILADYAYWHARERDMEIMDWYKNQRRLYQLLVLIYKVIKNVKRLFPAHQIAHKPVGL